MTAEVEATMATVKSEIRWSDSTWAPRRGCISVSPGCKHCYAETFAERWRGVPGHAYEMGFDPRTAPDKLDEPLHWKKPRRVTRGALPVETREANTSRSSS